MLPPIPTTTNSILPKISCEMERPRVISGFKRVAWPELRRLPLITSGKRLPTNIEQVRRNIEGEAVLIMEKHGLQFEDEEDHCDPQMEMRGVPEKPNTALPTIVILAPWSTEKQQLQKFRDIIAALRDERKQKTEFFKANKQALGKLYAASGFRRRVVGRRMDWALIEFDRPWHDRLPGFEEWTLSMYSGIPFMTLEMQLQKQTRSIEALSDLAWSSNTFDVYKIGTSSGPTAGSLLCTNNLVTIRDDQYMNPLPIEEMAFEPRRYTYGSERGFCAPGDSGSVVFDGSAGVVGLIIGGHQNNNSYNQGYGYVTPIEYVFKDIKDLLKGHVVDIRLAEL